MTRTSAVVHTLLARTGTCRDGYTYRTVPGRVYVGVCQDQYNEGRAIYSQNYVITSIAQTQTSHDPDPD